MERAAIPQVRKAAEDSFASGFYCAESVVMAIAKAEGVDSELLPRVATGFGGGMARTCGDCGALTGAIMAVGLALGRSAATDSVEPTFAATRRLIAELSSASSARATVRRCSAAATSATPEGQAMFKEQKLRRRCLRFTGGAAEIAARVIAESRDGHPDQTPRAPRTDRRGRTNFTRRRKTMSQASIKDIVRDKYAEAARRVAAGDGGSCCGAGPRLATS